MSGTDEGGDGGDGNQPTMRKILEGMRKLEQDLAVERAPRQMANPRGTGVSSQVSVPVKGTSAGTDALGGTPTSLRFAICLSALYCEVLFELSHPLRDFSQHMRVPVSSISSSVRHN